VPKGVYVHHPEVDTDDVNQFGQQLVPGSDPINVGGRVLLLRKPANVLGFTSCNEGGLVPVPCAHGLRVRREHADAANHTVREPDGAELPAWVGTSWMRDGTYRLVGSPIPKFECWVCQMGEAQARLDRDRLVPRLLGDITGLPPEDLPAWAR
jgi:hypothetical protein